MKKGSAKIHFEKPLSSKQMVHPWGVEPQSSEPESDILSIELRVRYFLIAGQRYNELLVTPTISPTFFFLPTQSYHFIPE